MKLRKSKNILFVFVALCLITLCSSISSNAGSSENTDVKKEITKTVSVGRSTTVTMTKKYKAKADGKYIKLEKTSKNKKSFTIRGLKAGEGKLTLKPISGGKTETVWITVKKNSRVTIGKNPLATSVITLDMPFYISTNKTKCTYSVGSKKTASLNNTNRSSLSGKTKVRISGRKKGTTTLTIKNKKTVLAKITLKVKAFNVENLPSGNVEIGKSVKLTTNRLNNVSYSCSKNVTISKGNAKFNGNGEAYIKVTYKNGSKKETKKAVFYIYTPLSVDETLNIPAGKSVKLNAKGTSLSYQTSNNGISVDKNGNVKGIKKGDGYKVTVINTYNGATEKKTVTVNVYEPVDTSALDNNKDIVKEEDGSYSFPEVKNVVKGEECTLSCIPVGDGYSYSSSDESIAQVSNEGKVTFYRYAKEVLITITTKYGEEIVVKVKAECQHTDKIVIRDVPESMMIADLQSIANSCDLPYSSTLARCKFCNYVGFFNEMDKDESIMTDDEKKYQERTMYHHDGLNYRNIAFCTNYASIGSGRICVLGYVKKREVVRMCTDCKEKFTDEQYNGEMIYPKEYDVTDIYDVLDYINGKKLPSKDGLLQDIESRVSYIINTKYPEFIWKK